MFKTRENWEGEYAYIGARGNTVIDYIFVNEKIKEKVIEFRFAERVDSNHMPICLELETEEEGRGRGNGKKEEIEEKKVICWDEEAKKTYQDKSNEIEWKEGQEEELGNGRN